MSDASRTIAPMSAVRRAWLRELGVERVWGGGSVAQASAPEVASTLVAAAQAPLVEAVQAQVNEAPLSAVATDLVAHVPEVAAQTKAEIDPDQAWAVLQQEISGCVACGLCKGRTQTVFGVGVMRARWMVIGEAPGEQEDLKGIPFVGRSGKLLDSMLAAVGHARDKDVFIANVIKCRPPGNRDPLPEEVAACSPYLMRQIALVQPEMILVVGRFAAQTLLGSDAKIGSLRGQRHEVTVDGRKIPVVVSYHPAYLLRSPQEKTKAWQDLRLAVTVGASAA